MCYFKKAILQIREGSIQYKYKYNNFKVKDIIIINKKLILNQETNDV